MGEMHMDGELYNKAEECFQKSVQVCWLVVVFVVFVVVIVFGCRCVECECRV